MSFFQPRTSRRIGRFGLLALGALALSGCNLVVMNPAGDVASQQADLIIYATVLMLIVIVPVLVLTVFFAIRYRADNEEAAYDPEWDHSVSLEIVVWSVPLAIIICLAGLTWVATHRLDPYRDLPRITATKAVDENVTPLQVQVVALDWKWLFIYPEYNIATVNEMAVVVDRPVEFKLTSTTVMNAFYIPDMVGMIYAMAGMETELNGVLNSPGTYAGFASHYNGAGFSRMRFDVKALDEAGFDAWTAQVADAEQPLDRASFVQLEQPSIDDDVHYYGSVQEGLWPRILNMCVGDDKLCMNDMMMVDALGGGGIDGLYNRELYRGLCSADNPEGMFAILRPDLSDRTEEITTAMDLLPPETPQMSVPTGN
ncbi:ubiquinol oxidase subunit II [Sulfitobacter pseudonitzschiae]|uniref:Ubiquinol oxidase polypeptide II n=1 Tax=Pseudosulfitobacter pseudonitzschiae TaxID=1402135 RepID=A0A9Q2S2A2_9RHOB|nr:ubiquinol oxidase subunit II [Pseudosulfitobacter pseudonitzschiae]MBM2294374.1 ubiquinol oxidase subunit II [Pseudosulfitobacter pseudonitzschiae]MBM2299299.1 ubiquinol oxidase subunit II [Pseudosulfitobacter pseudonitzschiae]MBM2304206.1 ubiquinol oxidase subunit II [Pseudosulfitobacter pseudonitzschiae]MBM2313986.1 ubiquinol oxidase subunit II [Pseudosulfitobacter pseudonitzschiae]MBM2318901.1 ubiquinol oxidase subunit II [Pseudosulfitobacter pseudonitzschiae]